MLGITRERVRQIQEKAITKLRGLKMIRELREFV
jgi:DNA-directed RNA polymerase sigma subunit (sigma70/sigma32)